MTTNTRCGCGYEWDGNIEGAEEHDCLADHHVKGCCCSDAYDICGDRASGCS